MSMPLFAADHEVPDSPEEELPPVAAEPHSLPQGGWSLQQSQLGKVRVAQEFKCATCDCLRPGGSSSGNVPPAATHAQFGPCEL